MNNSIILTKIFNMIIPRSELTSNNNIPHTIAPIVSGIEIKGLIAQPRLVEITKDAPVISPKQLLVMLRTNSKVRLEYLWPIAAEQ
jgi:hypothetical protein